MSVSNFYSVIFSLERLTPKGFLPLLLLLCACSQTPEDPFTLDEVRTFEVGRVDSVTSDVDPKNPTNRKIRQIRFRAKVINVATVLPVVDGTHFGVFEGFKKITRARVIDGAIEWSKSYEYDLGVPQDYIVYEFRIVGEDAHRGQHRKRVAVNPARKGLEAAIDLSAGGKIPLDPSSEEAKTANIERMNSGSASGFAVESVDLSDSKGKNLSQTTERHKSFEYAFYTCLHSERGNLPRIGNQREFTVQAISGFINTEAQIAKTNEQGCIRWKGNIENFKFYESERWFPKEIEICSKNKEASGCINHTIYIHPWSAINNRKDDFVFERGKTWKEQKVKPSDELIDGKNASEALERKKS